jgi:K+-sensing histidine kinase KdpD
MDNVIEKVKEIRPVETLPADRSAFLLVLTRGRPVAICAVAAAVALIVLIVDTLVIPDQRVAMLYSVAVLIVSFARRSALVIAAAIGCFLLTFLVPMFWPPGSEWWAGLPELTIEASCVLLVSGILLHRIRVEAARDRAIAQREQAWEQLKVLHGLLPICAWCKRIRAEQGDWVPIETYVAEHSEADFTHSICADCLAKQK